MKENELSAFKALDTKLFTVPPIIREPDNRGYLYLVKNTNYPDLIKFGRTIDMDKRLRMYNSDQPVMNVYLDVISDLLSNANEAESKIINRMKRSCNPVSYSKEWFEIKHRKFLIDLIKEAEEIYSIS